MITFALALANTIIIPEMTRSEAVLELLNLHQGYQVIQLTNDEPTGIASLQGSDMVITATTATSPNINPNTSI
jgi:hypothetical protein